MLSNIERLELRRKRMEKSPAILRGGFRPFFLGAAGSAFTGLAVWLAFLFALVPADFVADPLAWHRHEMVFGFVGAAIAGFALTAVPNWTGRLPIAGKPLAALFGLWLSGRLLPLYLSAESVLPAILDGGFYILLAAVLGREILQSRNRNLPIVIIIAIFGIAAFTDRLVIAEIVRASTIGWQGGLALATALIALIGGRIVPSFTRNWLAGLGMRESLPIQPNRFDHSVVVLTVVGLIAWIGPTNSAVTGVLLLGAGIANLVRLVRWRGWRCVSNPLLLVLHLGYLWLAIGVMMLGLSHWAIIPEQAAVHALSVGAMATMILAVMSRASLGHTGRPLVANRLITMAFVSITIAAAARVMASLAVGDPQIMLALAGLGWLVAFALFLVVFTPILCSPRADASPNRLTS